MVKKLQQLILTGTIPLLIGCGTTPKVQEQKIIEEIPKQEITGEFPEGNVSGVEYFTIEEKQIPYKLEEQVLFEERYYFEKRDQTPNTLPFQIYKFKDTSKVFDLDSGEISLKPKRRYIPIKEARPQKGAKDSWVDGVLLTNKGKYGIKANLTPLRELKKRAESLGGDYGYKVITTEKDTRFIIPTIKILGKEYFFPRVEDSQIGTRGKLDYFLILVEGATVEENNFCGNLTIINKNQVYRPTDPTLYPELFAKEENENKGRGISTERVIITTPEPINREELEAVPTTRPIN